MIKDLTLKIIKTNKEKANSFPLSRFPSNLNLISDIFLLVFNQLFFFPTYATLSSSHSPHFSVSTYASQSPSPSSHFSVSTSLRLPQFFKHKVKQQIISLSQFQPSLTLHFSLPFSPFFSEEQIQQTGEVVALHEKKPNLPFFFFLFFFHCEIFCKE